MTLHGDIANPKIKEHFLRHDYLKREYWCYWQPVHKDIRDYIYNQGGRFTEDESYVNDGKRRDSLIYNSTATIAHRTLVAGIFSSVTSPANPWFRLTIDDPVLKELKTVKGYFDDVTKIMRTDLGKSKFYTAAENLYAEISAFGTSALHIGMHPQNVFMFMPYTIGEYYIDTDDNGNVDYISREITMRARNIVNTFGEENVSDYITRLVSQKNGGNEWVKIIHVQERNYNRDVTSMLSKNKPWLSTYYEYDRKHLLRESGYDTQPFAAPRWYVTGSERYGTSPGILALPDVKELQEMEYDYMRLIKKKVDPSVLADSSINEMAMNLSAGGVTWVDGVTVNNSPKVSNAQQININSEEILLGMEGIKQRIKSAFYADLFFLIAQSEKSNTTATEIMAKQQEKLALLGPIVERLSPEFLRIIVTRCYDIENQLGRLPVPPKEIQGRDIKIEFISQIKQAQELTVVTPIVEVSRIAQEMSQTWPTALDKFNAEQALDVIASAHGVDASVINSDEEVAKLQAIRQAQQEQERQIMMAQEAAKSAKTLSDTDISGENALTAIAGGR